MQFLVPGTLILTILSAFVGWFFLNDSNSGKTSLYLSFSIFAICLLIFLVQFFLPYADTFFEIVSFTIGNVSIPFTVGTGFVQNLASLVVSFTFFIIYLKFVIDGASLPEHNGRSHIYLLLYFSILGQLQAVTISSLIFFWMIYSLTTLQLFSISIKSKKFFNLMSLANLSDVLLICGFITLAFSFQSADLSIYSKPRISDIIAFRGIIQLSIAAILLSVIIRLGQFPFISWMRDLKLSGHTESHLLSIGPGIIPPIVLLYRISPLIAEYPIVSNILIILFIISSFLAASFSLLEKNFRLVSIYQSLALLSLSLTGFCLESYSTSMAASLYVVLISLCSCLIGFEILKSSGFKNDIFKIHIDKNDKPLLFWSGVVLFLILVNTPFLGGLFIITDVFWVFANDAFVSEYSIIYYLLLFLINLSFARVFFICYASKNKDIDNKTKEHIPNYLPLFFTLLSAGLYGYSSLPVSLSSESSRSVQKAFDVFITSPIKFNSSIQTQNLVIIFVILVSVLAIAMAWFMYSHKYEQKYPESFKYFSYKLYDALYSFIYVDTFLSRVIIAPIHYIGTRLFNIADYILNGVLYRSIASIVSNTGLFLDLTKPTSVDAVVAYCLAGILIILLAVFSSFTGV